MNWTAAWQIAMLVAVGWATYYLEKITELLAWIRAHLAEAHDTELARMWKEDRHEAFKKWLHPKD